MRSYRYTEHEADMGLHAEGSSLEEVFCEGARGMFNLMFYLDTIQPSEAVLISCEADDVTGLYVEWLNELLAQRDIASMVFSEFEIDCIESIEASGRTIWLLQGQASGESIDPERHDPKLEVKAASYFGLSYEHKGDVHCLDCVVDV